MHYVKGKIKKRSSAELERVIADFPHIDGVAVIAARDDKLGETPLAVVYAASGVDVAQLIEYCKRHLSGFKLPRYVAVEREPLPRLATGKIAKPVLREKYADGHLRLPRVRLMHPVRVTAAIRRSAI